MKVELDSVKRETEQVNLFSYLQCSWTGEKYDGDKVQTYARSGKPLVAMYDLQSPPPRGALAGRELNMWRYRECLPVSDDSAIVTLHEGFTPLTRCTRISDDSEINIFLKDESRNPTGSFKARGISMAVSRAVELGIDSFVIPTAGNAGGALAAYCAKAGLQAQVFMPTRTPAVFKHECESFGAEVILIDGTISECAAEINRRGIKAFDVSTLKEPYRLEGKKTMGYEIAEQLNWQLPDHIIYPTGGGTGLIGIWKAFQEMLEMGWINTPLPRMICVQLETCYPIVKAFRQGRKESDPFENAGESIAYGLRVPHAFGGNLVLEALYDSGGTALTVSDQEIIKGIGQFASKEGVLLCPEGAATLVALEKLRQTGFINPGETALLINTGSAYKYTENFS